MDIALCGHPFEAIALSRVLAEIAECTQYLTRNPHLIDRFIAGSMKLDELLKAAKREAPKGTPYPFGHMTGIQSAFAHASPNLLALSLSIQGRLLTSHLVVADRDRIQQAARAIALILLTQYMLLRFTLLDSLRPLKELAERDAVLFDTVNIREVMSSETMPDAEVHSIRQALSRIGSA